MQLTRHVLKLKAAMFAALAAAAVALTTACGGANLPPCLADTEGAVAPRGPEGFPPSFPYIFDGRVLAAGQPVPVGTPVFARLGSQLSQVSLAHALGEYSLVGLAPAEEKEIGGEVKFFLGDPDGRSVQANESCRFNQAVSTFANITFDLTFDELP